MGMSLHLAQKPPRCLRRSKDIDPAAGLLNPSMVDNLKTTDQQPVEDDSNTELTASNPSTPHARPVTVSFAPQDPKRRPRKGSHDAKSRAFERSNPSGYQRPFSNLFVGKRLSWAIQRPVFGAAEHSSRRYQPARI